MIETACNVVPVAAIGNVFCGRSYSTNVKHCGGGGGDSVCLHNRAVRMKLETYTHTVNK